MRRNRSKLAAPVFALALIANGAAVSAQETAREAGKPDLHETVKSDNASPKPAPGRMFVTGRVLDSKGQPVPGAMVAAFARVLTLGGGPYDTAMTPIPIGNSRADESGRFRVDAPRTSSSRHEFFGAVAVAPGHGAGWVMLEPDDDEPTADITLRQERVVHGRLFDLQGRPVPGVTLSVASIRRASPQAPTRTGSRFEGVAISFTRINDHPGWPKPMTTDAEGRYTLRGLGHEQSAVLIVHHPLFALQRVHVEANAASESKPLTAALAPAQILTGRVTYADTGKGIPRAELEVLAGQGRIAIPAEFETDGDGRFRLNPPPANNSFSVTAFSPEGQPYLSAAKRLIWPKGSLEQSLDFALPRGILIHGKVTEEGSGKPIPGASVQLVSRADQQNRRNSARAGITADDGSFQFGALPGPGYVFVRALGDEYVLQELGGRMLELGESGGRRAYSHAFRSLNLKQGMVDQRVDLVIRSGATVTGRVVGADGQLVPDAWIFSRSILDPRRGAFRYWTPRRHSKAHKGTFEVCGLDSDTDVPLYFLDPKRKLGVVFSLSGKAAASEPVTVQLEACGAAQIRVVDPDGKPVAGALPSRTVVMVVTPGPPYSVSKDHAGLVNADEADVSQIDTVNYATELTTDVQGRLMLPVMVPGASYRFIDWSVAVRGASGPQVRKEFRVKPGETLDLGDIVIEKPTAQ
jgi:hypothetical protein